VDERRCRSDDAAHELFEGLAKEHALVVALLQAHGVSPSRSMAGISCIVA
jgi:hypothetical protein